MKLNEYFAPLKKWWWLLVVAMLVGGVSAYLTTRPLPSVYMARTTLVIGNALSSLNPTQDEIYLAQQLAQTYSDIAGREPIRLATMEALGLDDLPSYEAQPVPNSPFLEISVTYSDPQIAQIVANELANQLSLLTPTNLQDTGGSVEQDFIEQQLKDLQVKIEKTQEEITKKNAELGGMSSAVQINQTQVELDALDSRLSVLQQNYANMLASMPDRGRNTLRVYESAELPRWPVGPNKPLIILLAALGGILLATLAAYGIEALDTTVRTADEVYRLMDLPVVGRISDLPAGKNNWTFVLDQPNSSGAEDFRLLRTNLEFFNIDKPLKVYMISSAGVGDGKSTIAANLAMMMAMSEKSVILVDADFRRPRLADALGMAEGADGLSDVISHGMKVEDALQSWEGAPGLKILTTGTLPPNPAELLSSRRMDKVMEELRETADIIVLDGPPFIVSDASVLAAKVDGLIVVVRPGQTQRAALAAMKEQLERIGAKVLGLVLNQMPATRSYYSSRYTTDAPKKKGGRGAAAQAEPVVTAE